MQALPPRRHAGYLFGFALLATVAAALGCGPSVPSFPEYGLDAGIECDERRMCTSGEVCLQGRCYAECSATLACGPGETCTEGACRGLGGDAGRDAGRDAPIADVPPDACTLAGCTAPTPYCIAGTCVTCESSAGDCGGALPICDLARGDCVAFDAGNVVCAPCNNDFDCGGMATCTTLEGGPFRERVCLPMVGAGCPQGMTTTGAPSGLCVPQLNASCRNYVTARRSQACATAADCVPLGAVSGTHFDPNICPASVCLLPCGVATEDCPPGLLTCDASGYCAP